MNCGYCDFQNTASGLPPSKKQLQRMLRTAARLGAHQVTLAAGEGVDELPEITSCCRYYGYHGWFDYIRGISQFILQRNGKTLFFPQLEVGTVPSAELQKMRPYIPVVRQLLYSADDSLQSKPAHMFSPTKTLAHRMRGLENIGRAGMAAITGIMVGIGEDSGSWAEAARHVRVLNDAYGHIQSFVVVPFFPHKFSGMSSMPPVSDEVVLQAIADVRRELPKSIIVSAELQYRPHLIGRAYEAGATDLGPITVATSEHIDFDVPVQLEQIIEEAGRAKLQVCERMPFLDSYLRNHQLPEHVAANVRRFRAVSDKVFVYNGSCH